MPDTDIKRRKEQHISEVLSGHSQSHLANSFDGIYLPHNALPEINAEDISLHCRFLDFNLDLPFLISSMTGGPNISEKVNRHLVEAAEYLNIPMAVGSQKIAHLLKHGSGGIHQSLRTWGPNICLFSNIGAAQLVNQLGLDDVRRLCDVINADGLFIHLNALQEFFQPNGDTEWKGVLDAIERLCLHLGRPIIVKEVGFGISHQCARQLLRAGVNAIDVAGSGGTNWALVEGNLTDDPVVTKVASTFADWGIPTAEAVYQVHQHFPDCPLIASGGIRHGLDAAKAINLGANLVGQAAAILPAALESTEAVINHIKVLELGLRATCFATGAANLQQLKSVAATRIGTHLEIARN